VVEVHGHRHGGVPRHRPEHADQPLAPVGADGLDRGLQDDRRALLLGGGEDGVDGQVVQDVEGRDAVPVGEGAVEDLLRAHDRHRASSSSRFGLSQAARRPRPGQ
jgi:hypothetical protein